MRTESRGLAVVMGSAVVLGGLLLAQQPPRPSFEVASIKPSSSSANNGGFRFSAGRFTAENTPLRFLITWAYRVRAFQVSGGPGWIDSTRFDIAAKVDGKASPDQIRLMLQTLLEDRFKLKLRRETREHPVYTLVAAKSGLKLRESGADCEALAREEPGRRSRNPCGAWFDDDHQINGTKISMAQLIDALSNELDRPVIDKTAFAGAFDQLHFARQRRQRCNNRNAAGRDYRSLRLA